MFSLDLPVGLLNSPWFVKCVYALNKYKCIDINYVIIYNKNIKKVFCLLVVSDLWMRTPLYIPFLFPAELRVKLCVTLDPELCCADSCLQLLSATSCTYTPHFLSTERSYFKASEDLECHIRRVQTHWLCACVCERERGKVLIIFIAIMNEEIRRAWEQWSHCPSSILF